MLWINHPSLAVHCDGLTRRTLLRAGALALEALTIVDVLRMQAGPSATGTTYHRSAWTGRLSGGLLLFAFVLLGITDARTKQKDADPAQKRAASQEDNHPATGEMPARYVGFELAANEANDIAGRPGPGGQVVDLYGDPLPIGAVLRLGTARLRQGGQSRGIVAYSSDGNLLATSEGDAVLLWNAATGQRLRELRSANAGGEGPPGNVRDVAFAPQTGELAAIYNDGKLVVWDLKSGDKTLLTGDDFAGEPERDPGEVRGLAYSPSGTLLAVNWAKSTLVVDRTAGRVVQTLGGKDDPAQFGLCWSPKGTYVGRGSRKALVKLWDISTGDGYVLRDLNADVQAFVLSLAVSHDGRMLAAGCVQNQRAEIMICLWQLPSGRLKAKLPSGDAVSIHFTPDDKTLVSATEKGSIDIWDVAKGIRRQTIPAGLGVIRTAALSPDGKTVAVGAAQVPEIGLWDVETGQKKFTEFVGHNRAISSVAYTPDGELIATLAENGDIRLWDAVTGKQRRQMTSSYLGHLAFDPTGKQLAAAGQGSGEIHLWNVRTGERTFVLNKGEKRVRQVGFTPDGKYVVTVGSDTPAVWSSRLITDQIHVWDAKTGEHIRQFGFDAASTESMLLLPGNRSVVLGAAYSAKLKGIRAFDLETGRETGVAIGHEATVYSLAYGNGLVVSGSRDKTARLWDPATWQEIAVLKGHEDEVTSVVFSPDAKWLVSCDLAGNVRVWNVETRMQVHEFPGQKYGVVSACFSPKGDRIVTGLNDSTALVWAARFGTP